MTSADASAITAHNPFLGNELGIDGTPPVQGATSGDRAVAVAFGNGSTHTFHHQWLRHCCYCAACGNPADGIRFNTVIAFDRDVAPTKLDTVDGAVIVEWSDGHTSRYAGDWLWHHAYDGDGADRRWSWQPKLWRAELADGFPTSAWTAVAQPGLDRLRMYEQLRDYGIARISGVGTDRSATEALANLVGPIHETTVYGRIYDVRAEKVAKLGAKTGMAQAPHIDDAFSYAQPGIDVFHCLVNTDDGGLSTYVDGFAIAEALRVDDPAAFDVLTSVPITHVRRHPGEIDFRHRGPLISLDEKGQPCGIRYFDRALGPLDVDAIDVDRLYDGIRAFNQRMVSNEFIAQIRVDAGDGVLIDNHRVMHGRTAFDPAAGRHIRLCHVPRDEFHGRYRELARTLDPSGHDRHLPQGSR